MRDAQLAKDLYTAAHITGTFLLRSGQTSHEYFDKFLFSADPALLARITADMECLIPASAEVLAGLELGAIPIVTALSLQSGLPAAFIRKEPKAYGTCKQAEGAEVTGKCVCIVEDVVTTGGAILDFVRGLRQSGAIVTHVLCVVLRNPNAVETLSEHGLTLIPAFTMEELTTAAATDKK